MIANSREVKEPGLVFRQQFTAFEVLVLNTLLVSDGMILITIGSGPLLVRGQIAKRAIGALRPKEGFRRLENLFPKKPAIGRVYILGLAAPVLPAGIGLLEQVERLHIPMMRIAAVGFGLNIVLPHVFLALRKGPG